MPLQVDQQPEYIVNELFMLFSLLLANQEFVTHIPHPDEQTSPSAFAAYSSTSACSIVEPSVPLSAFVGVALDRLCLSRPCQVIFSESAVHRRGVVISGAPKTLNVTLVALGVMAGCR